MNIFLRREVFPWNVGTTDHRLIMFADCSNSYSTSSWRPAASNIKRFRCPFEMSTFEFSYVHFVILFYIQFIIYPLFSISVNYIYLTTPSPPHSTRTRENWVWITISSKVLRLETLTDMNFRTKKTANLIKQNYYRVHIPSRDFRESA